MRKPTFCIYAKTKTQISFTVTAKLISAFVFTTQIVQSLYFLNSKFQASSHLLRLYSPVCVGPGRKPEHRFSHNEAHIVGEEILMSNHNIGFYGDSDNLLSSIYMYTLYLCSTYPHLSNDVKVNVKK